MKHWRGKRLARGGIPHPRRLVQAGGDDAAAVRAERRRADETFMLQGRGKLLARGRVPHPRPLLTSGEDAAAVGTEARVVHLTFMLQGRDKLLPRGRVPHACLFVETASDDATAVRAEFNVSDALSVRKQTVWHRRLAEAQISR